MNRINTQEYPDFVSLEKLEILKSNLAWQYLLTQYEAVLQAQSKLFFTFWHVYHADLRTGSLIGAKKTPFPTLII